MSMKRAKQKTDNYLDFIPVKNPDFLWRKQENGLVTVTVPHTGFFDKVVQQLFSKPAHSYIDLDAYGSFIWELIDDDRTVYEISQALELQFGEAAQPLFDRLVAFFQILMDHKFIHWKS